MYSLMPVFGFRENENCDAARALRRQREALGMQALEEGRSG